MEGITDPPGRLLGLHVLPLPVELPPRPPPLDLIRIDAGKGQAMQIGGISQERQRFRSNSFPSSIHPLRRFSLKIHDAVRYSQ